MHKMWKIGAGVFVFFLVLQLPGAAHAAPVDRILEETESVTAPFGFRADQTARQVLSGDLEVSFQGMVSWIGNLLWGKLHSALSLTVKMAAAGMLFGILAHFPDGQQQIGSFACAVLIAHIALQSFSYAQSVAEETADGLFLFVQSLLPSVGAAAVASGSAGGGATCSFVFASMQVFMQIMRRFMLPLIAVITVLSVTDSFSETRYLSGVTALAKQLFGWITGVLLLFYGAVIGARAGAAAIFDRMAAKTVKYTVSNLVPVIGGALSDSLETVTVSAKAIRGALGISGMIGVGAVALSPVITLGALALSCKLAGVAVSVCGAKKAVELIAEIGSGITRLLAVTAASCVMFFISIAMLCFVGGAA